MIDVAPVAIVLAAGERPDWRIERRGDALVLLQSGREPIVAEGTTLRRAPTQTLIGGRDAAGRPLTIAVSFAACRLDRTGRRASHVALVAHGDLRLRGCFLGPLPGERPLLD